MKKIITSVFCMTSILMAGCTEPINDAYATVNVGNKRETVEEVYKSLNRAKKHVILVKLRKKEKCGVTFRCNDCGTLIEKDDASTGIFECKCPVKKRNGKYRKYFAIKVVHKK